MVFLLQQRFNSSRNPGDGIVDHHYNLSGYVKILPIFVFSHYNGFLRVTATLVHLQCNRRCLLLRDGWQLRKTNSWLAGAWCHFDRDFEFFLLS
jgi:hypothetical protein